MKQLIKNNSNPTTDDSDEYEIYINSQQYQASQFEFAEANFSRVILLSRILSICSLILIYIDDLYNKQGLWETSDGYRLLFYSHILLFIGMLLVIGVRLLYTHFYKEKLIFLSNLAASIFTVVSLGISIWTSGCIEQKLNAPTLVFIIGAFVIAVFIQFKPIISIFTFSASHMLFILLLTNYQSNSLLLKSNLINISLLVILACSFSIIVSNSRVKDLRVKLYLEQTVHIKTKELRESNFSLKQEIEEKKQALEKVSQLASIVESSIDGIFSIDLNRKITSWNKGAQLIYGYSYNEVVNQSILILSPQESYPEINDLLNKVFKGEKVSNYKAIRQKKDGKLIDVALTLSPLTDSNNLVIGASIIIRDITDSKKMERELAKLDKLNLIGQMAAGISHEVRNPMTTVRGFLQMLSEKQDCYSYKNYYELMINEIDRANSILSEFLSVGKSQSNKYQKHNLNSIIRNLLPLIEVYVTETGKLLRVELKEVPDLILDDAEIRQVLLNLTRNGLEAMNKGGILTIKTNLQEDKVVLTVADQGTGIDSSIISTIGTPFITTKDNGTGLGLAVCYGIAARHNSQLSFDTSTNGTTFRLSFPIEGTTKNLSELAG